MRTFKVHPGKGARATAFVATTQQLRFSKKLKGNECKCTSNFTLVKCLANNRSGNNAWRVDINLDSIYHTGNFSCRIL